MKNKLLNFMMVLTLIVTLLLLTGCMYENGVLEETKQSMSTMYKASVKEELETSIEEMKSDFLTEYALNPSIEFTDYCTTERIQENLIQVTIKSISWKGNTAEGIATYEGEEYDFTLTLEGMAEVTVSVE